MDPEICPILRDRLGNLNNSFPLPGSPVSDAVENTALLVIPKEISSLHFSARSRQRRKLLSMTVRIMIMNLLTERIWVALNEREEFL